jgi:hypothetical protein
LAVGEIHSAIYEKARREGESMPGFFCAFLPFSADYDKIPFFVYDSILNRKVNNGCRKE